MTIRRIVLGLVLPLVACAAPDEESPRSPARKPNILMIVADDLGFSDIGPFGSEIATPTLDTLAREGLTFTGFHVLPTCSPTRSVLLSGVDNHLAGLGTMGELNTPEMEGNPGYAGYLNFNVATLPELLKSAGYRTCMAGKWHLGSEEAQGPRARGFEETFILVPGGGSHWQDHRALTPTGQDMVYRRNGEVVESLPDGFYSTKEYTDHVLDWIDEDDDRPFFAYLAYTAPHDPLHAPKEYIDKHRGKYDDGWDVLRDTRLASLKALGIVPEAAPSFPRLPTVAAWADMPEEERREQARNMEVYAAMIDYMDEQIGRIVARLKETGEYDNTLILFFSDNGANGAPRTAYPEQTEEYLSTFDNSLENRGLPGSFVDQGPGWAQACMTPGRMFKVFASEGGIRTPCLVKVPGRPAHAGEMNHSFFHVRDIVPTLLDLAGAVHPKEIEGRSVEPLQGDSVLDLFRGEVETPYAGASAVGYELFGLKAYFDGDWKILSMPEPFGTGDWELFYLKDDPAEMNDLSGAEPARRDRMIALWKEYEAANGVLDIAADLSEVK